MQKTKRIRLIIFVYWFLLTYVVAALIWWFISLQMQNIKMTDLLINELKHDEPGYVQTVQQILDEKDRKTSQYIGEGVTFLALILLGAVFVYRATRRQLRLSMQQQNFMMAVTHELKTPIAVTRLNLETLQKRKLDEEKQTKLLRITLQEVNRLNSLCNNILLASQLDAGEYKINKNQVDISSLATRVAGEFCDRYPARTFYKVIHESLEVTGEELLLELLLSNLIENAVKYSPKDKPITIQLLQIGPEIHFIVKDEGAGIPEAERSRIFEKFYRIGNEATRTAKGTGLGLYLCRMIAKDHNAEINITGNDNGGAIFTVMFRS